MPRRDVRGEARTKQNFTSASYDQPDTLEKEAHDLRESLKSFRQLRFPQVKDPEAVEDGVHEVLVRVLKSAQTRGVHWSALCITDPQVLRQAAEAERSKIRRRLQRHKRVNLEMEVIADTRQDPTECSEEMDWIWSKVVGLLTPSEQTYLRLHYIEGLDPEEIAARMQWTREYVYNLGSRVLKKLQTLNKVD
jgi:RNA polymerase sigma factor (sigma-70 family)